MSYYVEHLHILVIWVYIYVQGVGHMNIIIWVLAVNTNDVEVRSI